MTNNQYLTALGISNFEFYDKQKENNKKEEVLLLILERKNTKPATIGNEKNMLIKMLIAINVDFNDCKYIQVENNYNQDIEKITAKAVLLIGNFTNYKHKFIIPHPTDILLDNNLKRDAWEVLKRLKKCLI